MGDQQYDGYLKSDVL